MGYHKDCHDPPVDEKTMLERQNDPRFIWQCKSCISQISRITTKKRAESQEKENSSKRKKEKKSALQTIDMFGGKSEESVKKGKEEVNTSAVKALKDKTSRKKDEEKNKKVVKSNE